MFLIFEGRRNSPGARRLLCTVYTILTPYGLVSMSLVRVQRSLTCGRCPIHVLGPVWSGTQGGGIQPVPAASRAPQPAPLQLPVGHRCPSKDHYLRNFFPTLLDEENIFVILSSVRNIQSTIVTWTQRLHICLSGSMPLSSPAVGGSPTKCRCGKL